MGFQMQFPFSEQSNSVTSSSISSSYGGGLSGLQMHALSSISESGEVPLKRQKSIYSLTLEEFQSTLGEPGKSFGSMNMEELLKNIWTAEEGQALATAVGSADVPGLGVSGSGISKQVSLPRQGSLSVKGALGRKTVDEIWKSMYQDSTQLVGSSHMPSKRRELTFGEVTLEDFLVKAGIVPEEETGRNTWNHETEKVNVNQFRIGHGVVSNPSALPNRGFDPQQALEMESTSYQSKEFLRDPYLEAGVSPHGQIFRQPPTGSVGSSLAQPNSLNQSNKSGHILAHTGLDGLGPPVGGGISVSLNPGTCYNGMNNILSLTVPSYKMDSPLSQSSDCTGTSQGNSPLSPVLVNATDGPVRKRLVDGPVDLVVQRRQRRMLKNRESAARSRARKQAYTMELENELKELREVNQKLKQKQEAADKHMKKVISITQEGPKEKAVLRRTRTGPW